MFNEEVRKILSEVIRSWQVIAVTVVLVIYFLIVNNVARTYRRGLRRTKAPKSKKASPEALTPAPILSSAKSEAEELGLEEDDNDNNDDE